MDAQQPPKRNSEKLHLVEICQQIALGDYEKAKELFDSSLQAQTDDFSQVMAEALAMMLVRIEVREFERDRLVAEISEAREELERHRARLAEENSRLRAKVWKKSAASYLVGNVAAMQTLRTQAERLALSRSTVLLTGETGSGKGLLARHIHDISPRSNKAFVDINCAAIPASLLESELFGIEAGVASGVQARIGRFEQADGGTLLLDEIGDMPLESQAKILHVIESGAVERIGGRKRIAVNVRLMAATHNDLEELVRQRKFRGDLFYRLNVVHLHVPPLRERTEDIPVLVGNILTKIAHQSDDVPRRVSPDALNLLMQYPWPGNIRQLHNVLERAALFADGPKITAEDIRSSLYGASEEPPPSPAASAQDFSFDAARPFTLEEMTAQYIRAVLAQNNGNKSLASRILGISREGLRLKLAGQAGPGPEKPGGERPVKKNTDRV